MSRVADATKKSRGAAITRTSPPDEQDERARQAEPWTTSEVPWDFAAPVQLREEQPGVARPPEITAARRRSLPDPGSVSRDELTRLVQRIFQPGLAAPRIRSVLFSAVDPAGGSGTLCAEAVDALANQTSRSVCLVDANLRTPSLNGLFGLDSPPGLSDVLLEAADLHSCLTRVANNFWLLPGGSRCADALPYLIAEQIRPHLVELLATFDYVIADTAPANVHREATELGSLLDGVVLIVKASATRREAAKRTAEQLQAGNAKILGVVLTNRTFPIPDRLYRML
jgi:Mrp family chromosome partitioning ATPase